MELEDWVQRAMELKTPPRHCQQRAAPWAESPWRKAVFPLVFDNSSKSESPLSVGVKPKPDRSSTKGNGIEASTKKKCLQFILKGFFWNKIISLYWVKYDHHSIHLSPIIINASASNLNQRIVLYELQKYGIMMFLMSVKFPDRRSYKQYYKLNCHPRLFDLYFEILTNILCVHNIQELWLQFFHMPVLKAIVLVVLREVRVLF